MADNSGYKEYVAGLIAGVATVGIGHPFDTVKVKMQKHNTSAHGITYRNSLHCTARILRTEGIKGLYRGATSSFVGMAFESSIVFGMYSQIKQSLQGSAQGAGPQPQVIIPSAAFSGSVISFILCPSELVKVRGIFRGGFTTLLRECIGNAVFFSVYEYVRYHMHLQLKSASTDHRNLIDVGVGIASGGLGGIAFWLAVLPLDVAKTIIQTTTDKNATRNPFQILSSIYRRAGLKGCYIGLGPTIIRAFPANAAAIVTWELAIKLLGIKRD
ncbi:mitochondrial arginine transporter BAC1 isoform X3 [Pyrus x bretschneideri]|uniref:mitochondrial arginine transporter BAC1 isoform X3 n=1 Tax=Pyrus x bretschneideri TaxID=225117 RepID=UPI00202F35E2|nr:mitochondrial arginine transporter BAC1 isoform X3 [Pyrus x bretschneideri]